jgi:hypothetical protein
MESMEIGQHKSPKKSLFEPHDPDELLQTGNSSPQEETQNIQPQEGKYLWLMELCHLCSYFR